MDPTEIKGIWVSKHLPRLNAVMWIGKSLHSPPADLVVILVAFWDQD